MSLMRKGLLWASTNAWMRERAMRTGFVRRSVKKFMPGERVEDAIEAAVALKPTGINTIFTRLGEIRQQGAAIECRIYAEDPAKGFMPSPGRITRLEVPAGEGIRVESGVEPGSAVSVHYDPLLMKLVARGATRHEALDRMARALDATVVEGVRTTAPFLRRVLDHPDVRRGVVNTQMVEHGAFA